MRIYTKVVLQFDHNGNLHRLENECESFDYTGKVSLCKGGSSKVKESKAEKQLASVSAEKWNNFRTNYVPIENRYIERVDNLGSDAERSAVVGRGVANVEQAVDNATPGAPTVSGQIKRGLGLGAGRTAAAVSSADAVETRAQEGKLGLIKLGRGMDASGSVGMTRQAATETSRNIGQAEAAQSENQANANLAGNVAGIGLNYYMKKPPVSNTPTYSPQAQNIP